MKAITAHFGDSARGMSDINPIALGIGMTLGILLGKIVFPVPGTVFSIGSAAGTLVLGLILGRLGRIGPFVTTMPFTAAQAISEFGLLIFSPKRDPRPARRSVMPGLRRLDQAS